MRSRKRRVIRMDNLGEKLQLLFNDPKGMEAVMEVAKTLGQAVGAQEKKKEGGAEQKETKENTEEKTGGNTPSAFPFPAIQSILEKGKGDRCAILKVIKPYVEDKKQQKIEQVMKTVQSVELLLQAKDLF